MHAYTTYFVNNLEASHVQQFVIFRLKITQFPVQHIPLLGLYLSVIFLAALEWHDETILCVLRYHSWTTACTVSLQLLKLLPVQHIFACSCFLSTNYRQPTLNIWPFNALFPQEPRSPSLSMIIALHFAAIFDVLRTLDLVMTQKFSQAYMTRVCDGMTY